MPEKPSSLSDASTVILLRPTSEDSAGAFELFMVKRHSKSRFMANAYVYPGGRLDPEDHDARTRALTADLPDEECIARLREALDPERARGLFVAALREAFEEAGVLFAESTTLDALPPLSTYDAWRAQLNAGTATLAAFGEAEGLRFSLDALHPFAHWITPEVEPRRYDTRFFVALCPPEQRDALRHDERETVDSLWIEPSAALARYSEGGFQLAPPTFRTLEELTALGRIDAVFARCREGAIPPVQPVFTEDAGRLVLLLPGDPEHPATAAGVCVEGSHRVALDDGRWWSI